MPLTRRREIRNLSEEEAKEVQQLYALMGEAEKEALRLESAADVARKKHALALARAELRFAELRQDCKIPRGADLDMETGVWFAPGSSEPVVAGGLAAAKRRMQ